MQNLPFIQQPHVAALCIEHTATLLGALKQMDNVGVKLLIVTEKGLFKSLISVGDIQRGIIKTQRFDIPVNDVLRPNVTVSSTNDSIDQIRAIMLQNRTEFMPVLDLDGQLVNIIFWKDIFDKKHTTSHQKINIPTVIMAGGQGARLKPITNIIPKALIPIGEKPIIEIIARNFAKAGASNFFISVNYKANMISDYFAQLTDFFTPIEYITEEKPLGTAGSLHLLKDKITTTFFLSNCDVLVDQDYADILTFHRQNRNSLTIVGALKHYNIPYGIMEVKEESLLSSIREKPELTYLVNTGMYVLEPHLLNNIPSDSIFHITHLIEQAMQRGERVGVFPVSEYSWLDIGEWKEYQRTQELFNAKKWS